MSKEQASKPAKPAKPGIDKAKLKLTYGSTPEARIVLNKDKYQGEWYTHLVREDHVQDALDMGLEFVRAGDAIGYQTGQIGDTHTYQEKTSDERIVFNGGKGRRMYAMCCPMEDHIARKEGLMDICNSRDMTYGETVPMGSVTITRNQDKK